MSERGLLYCVGATKAGTSRLYSALHDHPDCLVREVKEAHYWDTFNADDRDRQVAAYRQRLQEIEARLKRLEAEGKTWVAAHLSRRRGEMIDLLAVLDGNRSGHAAYFAWLGQGATTESLMTDFTPAYGLLDETGLERMITAGPLAKVVFLIRDPLARLWSHVRMQADRQKLAAEDYAQKANSILWRLLNKGGETHIVARGDYAGIITRLRRVVPEGRLLVDFAERVFTPEGWARLCGFLGIAVSEIDQDRRAHEGKPVAMRPDLVAQAVAYLRDQYDFVARDMGPLPQEWQTNLARVRA